MTLVDIRAAAAGIRRSPQTIYSWIRRGHLTTHGKGPDGLLVAWEDVQSLAQKSPRRGALDKPPTAAA